MITVLLRTAVIGFLMLGVWTVPVASQEAPDLSADGFVPGIADEVAGTVATPAATAEDSVGSTSGAVILGDPPSDPAQAQTVPLQIIQGEDGSTLALVPVYVNNQGPYSFALDTGASKSLIERGLAQQLNLPSAGSAGQITGIVGTESAPLVEIGSWSAGSIQLPSTTLVAIDLPGVGGHPSPLNGLLGSDVLSQFGVVTIDYERGELIVQNQVQTP